jgi:type II secretory pathway component PulK
MKREDGTTSIERAFGHGFRGVPLHPWLRGAGALGSMGGRGSRRRGAIFITALGIIIILSGLVLVFAMNMRTESLASSNRLAAHQADAVELGAEQWVLSVVAQQTTAAATITQVQAAGLQVGSGYFWILSPYSKSDQQYQFGICDESAKLNINSAIAPELEALPTTTLQQDIADAIVDWRSTASKASADGAESSYYNSLPDAYNCKNEPYESVEELLLVKGVTPQMLFGYDLNRNGVIEPEEQTAASGQGISLNSTSTNDSRGIYNYLTVWSIGTATVRGGSGLGLINVNTAPAQVLACLPGVSQSAAQAIVNGQAANSTASNAGWIQNIVGTSIYREIAPMVTAVSYQYSADIAAVSGDGRAFKRVKIVVDCRQSPPRIVYRKDLTSCGWPLPEDVRESLRSGQGVPADMTTNTGGVTVGGQ